MRRFWVVLDVFLRTCFLLSKEKGFGFTQFGLDLLNYRTFNAQSNTDVIVFVTFVMSFLLFGI